MKALPFERFVIRSSESTSALVARLQSSVAKPPPIREMWAFGCKPQLNAFYGSVDPSGFRIWRSLRYRSSLLPLAVGRISAQGSGSTIDVTVRPAIAVLIFIGLWCGGLVAIWIVVSVVMTLSAPDGDRLVTALVAALFGLAPLGLATVGYALASAAFWGEAKRQRPALRRLLESTSR